MIEQGESASSNSRSCAACKHQRRRCYPGCVLARYFPAKRAARFEAVLRLFGISNLMRFYNAASSEQRDHVVATMTFEAETRSVNPVLGCVAIIHDLNAQIDATFRELDATFSQLNFYRRQQQEQQQMMMMMMPPPLASMPALHANSLLQQQQQQLPPPLLPPVLMHLDDRGVDIGRSHGSRPSGEGAIRSSNPAAVPPNPVVLDPSNSEGLDKMYGIQGWSARTRARWAEGCNRRTFY